MVTEGDIVTYRDDLPWAVLQLERATPHGLPPDAILVRDGEQLRVSTAGLSLLASPVWQPGQRVQTPFGSRHATVVRDLGGDHVEVTDERPRRNTDNVDGRFTQTFLVAIPRGRLAHANLHSIVQKIGN
jgi:hypothetical protein